MHDFKCVKPEEMLNPVFAERAREKKGDGKMGALKEMEEQAEARGEARGKAIGKAIASETIARSLIKAGQNALEDIAVHCGLTLQRVQELAKTIS